MMERVRIGEVYYGAYDPKGGGIEHGARIFDHSLHHPKVIGGIQEERCSKLFSRFFKDIRRDR
jgi:tRNA(adenine34) deaminase